MLDGLFISNEKAEELLNHPNNKIVHGTIGKGNRVSENNKVEKERYTIEEKADIAVMAEIIGNKETAEIFDMNPSQVSIYKRGVKPNSNHTKEVPDEKLREATVSRIVPIKEKALDKATMFLDLITPAKAEKLSARDLASSAKSLSDLHEKLSDKSPLIQNNNVVFYSPRIREARDYNVIEVEAS